MLTDRGRHLAQAKWFLTLIAAAIPQLLSLGACADEAEKTDNPQLVVRYDGGELVYKTDELLMRDDLEEITITDVAAYPRQEVTFRAVRMANLLEPIDIADDATIEFTAVDGFALAITPKVLLNTSPDQSVAYLAIEDPARKWPLRPNGDTAGPYYLFWLNPELSNIGREEWPFQIDVIEIRSALESIYPAIFPAKDIPVDDPIRKGLQSFVKNCLTCHTMNGEGPASMGPDLNLPMSPVEYFRDGILRTFIRDPQSIRLYPTTPMAGFGTDLIADEELDQLLAYMTHMVERRTDDASATEQIDVERADPNEAVEN